MQKWLLATLLLAGLWAPCAVAQEPNLVIEQSSADDGIVFRCSCLSCQLAGRAEHTDSTGEEQGDPRYDDGGRTPQTDPDGPQAFRIGGRWSRTATNASTGSLGTPITLTWGIIADGVAMPGDTGETSRLINFLDTRLGGGVREPAIVSQKTWFRYFQQSFDRWSQLAGLTYVYESRDGGDALDGTSAPIGQLGVYPDIRIGGHFIDGETGSNTLAYNYFPNHGDMVIDTGNPAFFGNAASNALRFRNTLMHEHGHGLGFNHLESSTNGFLMEPSIQTSFDGPQFDEILAAQRNYGDPLEKDGGNDTIATATLAREFTVSGTWGIGASAGSSAVVGATARDFVSVDDDSDNDYYRFTVSAPARVNLSLIPVGPTYNEGPQDGTQTSLVTSQLANLGLALFQQNTLMASVNANGLGLVETLTNQLALPGFNYYARAFSVSNNVQMYRLSINATYIPEPSGWLLVILGIAALGGRNHLLRSAA